jgi:DNA polymerase III subunit beta
MKVTLSRKALLTLCQHTSGVVDKRATLPSLNNLLLETDEAALISTGTDLFQVATDSAVAVVAKSGRLSVPAREFTERVAAMPEGDITLTADNGTMTMKGEKVRQFRVRYLEADDFPEVPRPNDKPELSFEVEAVAVLKLIARTKFAISPDEKRPHTNSLLVHARGDSLSMVATDGHRLAKVDAPIKTTGTQAMLIPLKAVNELRRLIDDTKKDIPKLTCELSGKFLFFRSGAFSFGVKLMEAQFPPYEQLLPKKDGKKAHEVTFGRKDAIEAVNAVRLASATTGGIRFVCGPERIRLVGESPELGEAIDEIPSKSETLKKDFVVGVGTTYVLDVLNAIEDEQVSMRVGPLDTDPIVFTSENYVSLLMPFKP